MIMSKAQAIDAAADVAGIAAEIGRPATEWANDCHRISLAVLRTGRFGPGRICRGWAPGIGSQHSWIVLGDNRYDLDATIVDPTMIATGGPPGREAVILVGTAAKLGHRPHGYGLAWNAPMPEAGDGTPIALTPTAALSREAREFLDSLGPLDLKGWMGVAHLPVMGWPAGEIFAAMNDTRPVLSCLIPIDILGMTTDLNPKGLYR